MYKFQVIKSPETSQEKFESALNCARVSIESIFNCVSVVLTGDEISIENVEGKKTTEVLLLGCKEKIKGSFCDGSGTIYPEFARVIPIQY